MLTNAKALYQVKLILDYLPKDEYDLIPQEVIEYVENNFEIDKNIKINPEIPLESQNIDDKTYEILEKIIKKIDSITNKKNDDISKYVESTKKSNEEIENIRLNNLVEDLKEKNGKIPKVKNLVQEYKNALRDKDNEITKLQKDNEILLSIYKKISKFIRKIFVREKEIKLLSSGM